MNAMSTITVSATTSHPELGQLVEVRRRQWIVNDVRSSALTDTRRGGVETRLQHLVTASSIDEDALGEELQVIWELEPGARILEKAGLPKVGELDEPRRDAARPVHGRTGERRFRRIGLRRKHQSRRYYRHA